MSRRTLAVAVLLLGLAFAGGIVYAIQAGSAESSELLFDSGWWLIVAAPFAGMLLAGFTKRDDPRIEGDKVLRHDSAAILEHWTHGIGTAALLVTGVMLGFLIFPAFVADGAPIWQLMNVHFVSAVLFLFGTFYYAANTALSMKRYYEHLPRKGAIKTTIQHYGHMLGVKNFEMPKERKYYESEAMAYIMALAAAIIMVVTGLIKSLAHVIDMPGWLTVNATLAHDAGTLLMALFFVAHVTMGAILPMAWPGLRSMFTGYMSLDKVREDHAAWLEELESAENRSL